MFKHSYKQFLAAVAFALLPLFPQVASAQINTTTCTGTLNNAIAIFDLVTCVINRYLVPIMFAVAIVFFLWGVLKFIQNAANEAKRKEGQQFMLWSVIALFVMVSVWGLVNLLQDTVVLDNQRPTIPQFQISQ